MANPQFKNDDFKPQNLNTETASAVEGFDEAPRRIPKAVKWLAGTAVGLVILAGVGGIAATQLIDQQKYKALAISKVEEATGYTIDWKGNINLGLMPLPHASVNDLTVKAGENEILSIASANVQVALAPLLSKKIEIQSVTLDTPVVTLTTAKNGQQLWVAKPKASETSTDAKSEADAASGQPMDVSVNRVEIQDGKIVIDNQQSASKQELAKLNLLLQAKTLNGPFDLSGNTEWSGQLVELKATTGEVNANEGRYPVQASIALPKAGAQVAFSGLVDSKTTSANGDVTIEAEDLASALKAVSGQNTDLPQGLQGKTSLAGKLVYSSQRVAMDEMALVIGKIGFSGKVAAEGLGEGSTPQLSFDLKPTSQTQSNADQVTRILSDLTITARGSVENEKIQIADAHIKTLGNDVTLRGYASTGAQPDVDLTLNASEINLDRLSSAGGAATENAADSKSAAATSEGTKSLGFAMPFAGRVRADIAKLVTGGQTYSDIQADLVSKNGVLTINKAAVTLPQDTSVAVNGKIQKTADMSGLDLTVAARVGDVEKLMTAYQVDTSSLPQKIGAANLNGKFSGDLQALGFDATLSALQFRVTGEGIAEKVLAGPEIKALKFNIAHPNFNEAMRTLQPGFAGSSGFAGPLNISGQVALGTDQYDISDLSGKLGQTTLSGQLSAITKPKPSLTGQLNFGSIVLPSATEQGGTSSAAAGAAPSAKGERWSRETIDTAWMHQFDANLKIQAKSITQNLWKLTDANLDFKLNDGVLTLNDVSAGLFGGKASLSGVIQSGSGAKDPLSMSTKLNANNVDAQGLMSAATGKVSHTLSGTLSNVDVAIKATGSSASALVQTLGGTGSMDGKNIVVQGIDAAQLAAAAKGSYKPLDRAGSLFQSFQSGQTEFTDFAAAFTIENGIVQFSKINFDGPKALLNTTGSVNLPLWTVDLKNSMTVKDTDIPPFDFTIRGPLDNPINSGGDIINNYLQNKLQKKATKFIEDKLGGKLDKFLGTGSSGAGATDAGGSVAPAGDSGAADQAQPAQQQPTAAQPNAKQQAAQEAVKALQGLFAK